MRHGTSIVITRPISQAQELAHRIEIAGGRAIIFPALEIIPETPDPTAQTKIDAADIAIFISANAVEFGLRYASIRSGLTLAAIGNTTATALCQAGHRGIITSAHGFDSAALLATPALQGVAGKHIVIFRGVGGRETLRDTLRHRGAKVEYIECYTRRRPNVAPDVVSSLLARHDIDAIQALSRETLENFCSMIGNKGVALLRHVPLFAPHPAILEGARILGFSEGVVTEFGDAGLLAALQKHFGR